MMDWFLFLIVGVWMLFAVVQDLRTREVYNWLNFSLLAIVLAYKAFLAFKDGFEVFGYAILGGLVFYGIAMALYYGKVFAGGDAKLLIGVGAALPYQGLVDLAVLGGGFVVLLFAVGAIYSLIYSLFLVGKNYSGFRGEFKGLFTENRRVVWIFLGIAGLLVLLGLYDMIFAYIGLLVLLIGFLWMYLKAVEKGVLIVRLPAGKLSEGDWLEKDVKIGKRLIKKSVHGLSLEDIRLIKKAKKSVLIKQGIPFIPAFLLAWIVMVLFFSNGLFHFFVF